jgi:hypothetical protein
MDDSDVSVSDCDASDSETDLDLDVVKASPDFHLKVVDAFVALDDRKLTKLMKKVPTGSGDAREIAKGLLRPLTKIPAMVPLIRVHDPRIVGHLARLSVEDYTADDAVVRRGSR